MLKYTGQKLAALAFLITAMCMVFTFARQTLIPEVQATGGHLNLGSWDFETYPQLPLEGEWELYWKQFIPPEQLLQNALMLEGTLDYLPRWWNHSNDSYPVFPSDGYATYRLRVSVPSAEVGKLWGIMLHDSAFTYKLFLNSEELLSRGSLAKSKKDFTLNYKNKSAAFTVPAEEFDLTLQVSMFGDRNGGVGRPIQIGRYTQTVHSENRQLMFDAFLLGVLVILAVYHILIYSLRVSDESPLIFAALCLVFALKTLFQNSKIVFFLFPGLDQVLFVKLWYSTYYLLVPLFVLFFRSLFPRQLTTIAAAIASIVSIMYLGFVAFTPLAVYSRMLNSYHILFLLISAYTVLATLHALKMGETGADIMLTGLCIILVFAGNEILHNIGMINTGYFTNYGFLLFITSQAYLLSHRTSTTYSEVESLSTRLQSSNRELERVNALKDSFLANTSHELKTPLNGIIGIAESITAQNRFADDSELRQNLELIVSSGRRLSGLVSDLLDLEKIKNNDISLNRKTINLREQTTRVLDHFTHICKQKKITLVNTIDREEAQLYADENRVQQILFNLIGNAVKFTEKGSVTVSGRKTEKNGKPYFALSISDSGIGIAEKDRENIFDPFVQADGSITRRFGGTGLGLTISRLIAEKHGGMIEVDSSDEGSVFTCYLPLFDIAELPDTVIGNKLTSLPIPSLQTLADVAQSASSSIQNSSAPAPPRDAIADSTIMIVDDDPVNITILKNQLGKNESTTIIEACNGKEAIDHIERGQKPDLILLDIMMPLMSGYEVARRIRRTHQLFDIPIIMLTARDSIQDIITAFQSGANDYLTKPFNAYELIARINTHLSLQKAISERQRLISLEKDIAIASEIQRNTLTGTHPESPAFSLTVRYVPMQGIGGDFYGFHKISPDKIGIFLADVCGHGIHAALIASMLKVIFSTLQPFADKPVEFLRQMNSIIMKNTEYSYITAVYAVLDTQNMTLCYSRAGHEVPLIHRPSTGGIISKSIHGRIIGFSEDVNFEEAVIPLKADDRIIFATDGIEETFNSDFEMYGRERLISCIEESSQRDTEGFASTLIDELKEWNSTSNFRDDLTLIVLDLA